MRPSADFLGLVAYLTLMFGRLPDREVLEAARAAWDDPDDGEGIDAGESEPHLYSVPPAPASLTCPPEAAA